MGTQSNRLRLEVPTTSDAFDTAKLAANWTKLDAFPGRFLCTSLTRPTDWGSNQIGMEIWESDTSLVWWWNGTIFIRSYAVGWLNGTQRTTDFTTNQTTPQTVISTSITYPAGGRRVQVSCSWGKAEGDDGVAELSLFRDTTQIQAWNVQGKNTSAVALEQGTGGSVVLTNLPPSPGNYAYALKFRVPTGFANSVQLRATATKPITIDVVEV